jgi:hypothetical protein
MDRKDPKERKACRAVSLRPLRALRSSSMFSQFTPMWLATALCVLSVGARAQAPRPAAGTAADHHAAGVEHHLKRNLDEASREYARALDLDPPREPTSEEWTIVRRFAPRLYTTASEYFPLKDAAAVLHPDHHLIAYHFFWEDDIDFPDDNDPCDHELMWVQYAPNARNLEKIWTYFHGRILSGGEAALADAHRHAMRPRVNVQWGKHGSLPVGWEQMSIQANEGDAERNHVPLDRVITLAEYNRGTFEKLHTEGRRLIGHPLGRRLGWPERFSGDWSAFVDFSRLVDPVRLLDKNRMVKVSHWNSATINQHFLTYNFRPKTEWPVDLKSVVDVDDATRAPAYHSRM